MASLTVYLKLEKKTQTEKEEVFLEDVGKVFSTDKTALAKIKAIRVYRFREGSDSRCVVSVMKIIEEIQKLYPAAEVQTVGEAEFVLEWVKVAREKGAWVICKIVVVAMISFFGAAFTIMAYHNDIGLSELFSHVYTVFTGRETGGFTELEIAYSIGLCVGIVVFFNHIGGRRLTKDPTPIEAEMFDYEDTVENTLIDTANREGKTIDVD